MPTTIEALLVATVGLVPGAAFVAALDSQVGQGRSALPDRLTRYLTVSVALHAALAPATFMLWRTSTELELTQLSPWAWWVPALLYVAAPALLGTWHGRNTRHAERGFVGRLATRLRRWPRFRQWLSSFEVPSSPASSWDQLFTRPHIGLIRVRLRESGSWVGGFWGQHATRPIRGHVSTFPDQGELLIPQAARLSEDGSFDVESDGSVRLLDEAVLLRWDDIDVLPSSSSPNRETARWQEAMRDGQALQAQQARRTPGTSPQAAQAARF